MLLEGLLPTNGIKRTEYYETIQVGASFSIGAPTNDSYMSAIMTGK